jgi:hypothetical protein
MWVTPHLSFKRRPPPLRVNFVDWIGLHGGKFADAAVGESADLTKNVIHAECRHIFHRRLCLSAKRRLDLFEVSFHLKQP